MKTSILRNSRIFAVVSGVLLLMPVPAEETTVTETAHWKFSEATEASGKIEVQEAMKLGVLSIQKGARLGEENGKTVIFDGTQSMLELREAYLEPESGFKASFKFKPTDSDGMMTVFQCHQSFEFRYYPGRKAMEFIVYYGDENKFMVLQSPASLNEWSTVTGSVEGTQMKLVMNGSEQKASLPEPMRVGGGQQVYWFACAGKNAGVTNRPFLGSLSDIHFTVLKK
jgi:hypothetical protein